MHMINTRIKKGVVRLRMATYDTKNVGGDPRALCFLIFSLRCPDGACDDYHTAHSSMVMVWSCTVGLHIALGLVTGSTGVVAVAYQKQQTNRNRRWTEKLVSYKYLGVQIIFHLDSMGQGWTIINNIITILQLIMLPAAAAPLALRNRLDFSDVPP